MFGEGAKIVVGGSDQGAVYVFEWKTGVLKQTLQHQKEGLVQTIVVRTN